MILELKKKTRTVSRTRPKVAAGAKALQDDSKVVAMIIFSDTIVASERGREEKRRGSG